MFHFLSDKDRARLRPTVDAAALERFLSAAPRSTHRLAVLSFVRQVTLDDLRDLNQRLGDAEANRDLDQLLRRPLPPGEVQVPKAPDGVPFQTLPTINYVTQLMPPDDPALLALWRAIEPGSTDEALPGRGAV
jgi:hypothetical protein